VEDFEKKPGKCNLLCQPKQKVTRNQLEGRKRSGITTPNKQNLSTDRVQIGKPILTSVKKATGGRPVRQIPKGGPANQEKKKTTSRKGQTTRRGKKMHSRPPSQEKSGQKAVPPGGGGLICPCQAKIATELDPTRKECGEQE